jgi:transcriptional regulator with XRE-family HTH domain
MSRSLYGERDYAFGQRILTLRTQLGLTQTGLAELLHVSRRAVTEWEAGSNYPKAEHLQQLIALGVQQQAFPAGREAEEIRALWHAAHQKLLFDEAWLRVRQGNSYQSPQSLPIAWRTTSSCHQSTSSGQAARARAFSTFLLREWPKSLVSATVHSG